MRIRLTVLCGLILLAGCAKEEAPVSHRDILDEYKALNVRLDTLAAPLLAANADLCEETVQDNGIRWHSIADYPEDLRPVSESYWGVGIEPSVFYVVPDSPADQAGIKSGNRPKKDTVDNLQSIEICKNGLFVSYADEINAFATGNEVVVTSGMLRAIKDDKYLTLVLAHELSHNILGHATTPDVADAEAEADLTAVKLLARAGIDYHEAIKRREAHQLKTANGSELSEVEAQRIEDFKSYADQVQKEQDAGTALMP